MIKSKTMEQIIFVFFDFCADHRFVSFFTILATVLGLAEIATVLIRFDCLPIRVIGFIIGASSAAAAHLGFGSWFVTKE